VVAAEKGSEQQHIPWRCRRFRPRCKAISVLRADMHASRSLAGARLRGAARTSGSASTRRLHAAAAPVLRRSGPHARGARAPAPRAAARRGLSVNALLDYVATASDDGVLRLPARTELDPEEIKNVYNYPRWAGKQGAAGARKIGFFQSREPCCDLYVAGDV
jgi:hypothetical protein